MKGQMKAIRWGLFTSVMVLVTAGLAARAQYAGGSGTADDPYLIATAAQLNVIGLHPEHSAKHFRLTADIDMNDLAGAKVNLIPAFEGVFDGNDHTIANLIYRVKDEDSPPGWKYVLRIGLFRVIRGADALVQNLGLIEPDVRPDPTSTKWMIDRVGALVGELGQGWVRNCYVKGGHVRGRSSVGGLVGECYGNAAVSECWSSAEVSGDFGSIGGLVGNAIWTSIWSCHAGARVSGVVNVGGLVGALWPDSTIEDCFTTGTVTGSQAGGLVGYLDQSSVSRCYSTASLSGENNLGGLVGLDHGLIHASWAGGEVAGSFAGGLVGGTDVGDGIWTPYFDTKVTDSYATGAVRGDKVVGGLVGWNEGTLLRCYSTGAVTTTGTVPASDLKSSAGGLVAIDKSVSKWDILGCFWDMTSSGLNKSAGGTGKTTPEMQDEGLYLVAGWDFAGETANGTEDLWKMSQQGRSYPKLVWEKTPAGNPPDPNAGK